MARSAQEEEAVFQGRPAVPPVKRQPNRRQDFGGPEVGEAGPGIA